jgi:hypothetical protein
MTTVLPIKIISSQSNNDQLNRSYLVHRVYKRALQLVLLRFQPFEFPKNKSREEEEEKENVITEY